MRVRAAAAQSTTLGEELQLRAAAAEAADAPTMRDQILAAASIHKAVTIDVTVVGAGGAIQAARLRLGEHGVSVRAQSGLRFTMPELAIDLDAPPEVDPAAEPAPPPVEVRPGDDPQPAPETTREVEPATPIGGPVAAEVHNAVALPADQNPAVPQYLYGDPLDPSPAAAPELRAGDHDGAGAPPPKEMPPAVETDRQDWACWMAGAAAHDGLPPVLPLMIGLASGGMRNMPEHDGGVGFFATPAGSTFAPAGHGLPRGAQPDAEWWLDHPKAQLDHLVNRLQGSSGGVRAGDLTEPEALSRWAHEVQPGLDPDELTALHDTAADLVARCRGGGAVGGEGMAATSAMKAAVSQLGVHERAPNAGPEVDQYLAAAGAGSGNPWCAGFVSWSMQQAGHELPGTGWAAVSHWVSTAQAGEHGMQIVSAADARPGDVVAYDWGGGSDFSADGHIGLLESEVSGDGRFVAIEGNTSDAVARMGRSMGEANVVFIRVGG